MSGRCFGDCMILKRIGEKRATAIEPPQTTSELRLEARHVIGSHRVDSYEHDEFRRRGLGRLGTCWHSDHADEPDQGHRQRKTIEAIH